MKRIFEILLVAVVLVLAGTLWWPRAPRDLPAEAAANGSTAPVPAIEPRSPLSEPAEPGQIARLFGWSPPQPAPADTPESPPEPPAERTGWLIHVGRLVDSSGRLLYLFKDTTNDTALSLSQGEERRGWRLVEVGETTFVAEYEGRKYLIDRKD